MLLIFLPSLGVPCVRPDDAEVARSLGLASENVIEALPDGSERLASSGKVGWLVSFPPPPPS